MKALAAFEADLVAELAASHSVVVRRALDLLESRALTADCSYATWRAGYVNIKVKLKRVLRDIERAMTGEEIIRLESTADLCHARAQYLHTLMYESVCGQCKHCTSRRKMWPLNVGRPAAPIDVNKLLWGRGRPTTISTTTSATAKR